MSDAYNVGGITVTPGAGGYYTLTGPGIEGDGEKVQGKEKADTRAAELDKANGSADADAHIAPQGGLDNVSIAGTQTAPTDTRSAAEIVQERDAGLPDPVPPTKPADDGAPVENPEAAAKARAEEDSEHKKRADAAEEKNAALQASLTAMDERFAKLEKLMGGIQTVVADDGPGENGVPNSVPREYAGQMDPKVKAALAKLGIGVTTIVLEENDSIPPTGLFISHNGRGYMIKPGEEVDVPDFLIGVLDDAVMSAPVIDGASQKILGYRDRSKYPYRRVNTDKG